MPRRAVLHKYPVIGRFAHRLRPRHYLWSLRRKHLRRAYYAGSILAFLPLMGVQLPIALILALTFRCNFMVLGGLQFITNPLTAAPIYYATHQIGAEVLERVRAPLNLPTVPDEMAASLEGDADIALVVNPEPGPLPMRWARRVMSAISSMLLGGVIVGAAFAFVLDHVDRWVRRTAPALRMRHAPPPFTLGDAIHF